MRRRQTDANAGGAARNGRKERGRGIETMVEQPACRRDCDHLVADRDHPYRQEGTLLRRCDLPIERTNPLPQGGLQYPELRRCVQLRRGERRADGSKIRSGRKDVWLRVRPEELVLFLRAKHQNATRRAKALAKRCRDDRARAKVLWKLRAGKTLAMPAGDRDAMCIVDIKEQTVAILQLSKFGDRRTPTHRVNAISDVRHAALAFADILERRNVIVLNGENLRFIGQYRLVIGERCMAGAIEDNDGLRPTGQIP